MKYVKKNEWTEGHGYGPKWHKGLRRLPNRQFRYRLTKKPLRELLSEDFDYNQVQKGLREWWM